MQDRVQVFNQEDQLLISFGGHGLLPGQFQGLVNIAIDKNNRVFTSEIYPGRVQQFRYVNDAEAEQLRKEREQQREKKAAGTTAPTPQAAFDSNGKPVPIGSVEKPPAAIAPTAPKAAPESR